MAPYIVRLTAEERAQLTALIAKGRRAASVLTRARILRKADTHDEGPHWTDPAMAAAVESSLPTVHRVRQAFVEDGLATVLERQKPTGRQDRKLAGAQEPRLIALACSAPPAEHAHASLPVRGVRTGRGQAVAGAAG